MEYRVYLRAFMPDDFKTSIQWRNDEEIWSQLGGVRYYVSEIYEKKWIEDAIFDTKSIRLAICLKKDDSYIGNVYLTDLNLTSRSAVSHVFIGNKDQWGKGLATEAYQLLLEYAFQERGLHSIRAFILEDNVASCRLHEKCGYSRDGILRESVFKNGRWQNQVIYTILEGEYRNKH